MISQSEGTASLESKLTYLLTRSYYVPYHLYSGWKDLHDILLFAIPQLQNLLTEEISQVFGIMFLTIFVLR